MTAPGLARAKLNLCLHVTGLRADGYHMLDSLVVFTDLGDLISVEPAERFSLSIGGPFGQDLIADADNLVLRAAALMPQVPAAIHLQKNLPLASGIGGGSADAAATLRALSAMSGLALPGIPAVAALGADVPVCLRGEPMRMRGVGELLEPVPPLPPVWLVLVNPGVGCPTPQVFAALTDKQQPPITPLPDRFGDVDDLVAYLAAQRNDLEAPAMALRPVIARALAEVAATSGCLLARMSGSGATVFGLFEQEAEALAAAEHLRREQATWWVATTKMTR